MGRGFENIDQKKGGMQKCIERTFTVMIEMYYKVENFINRKTENQRTFITSGDMIQNNLNGRVSYKEALQESKWSRKNIEKPRQLSSSWEDNEQLRRCLVGRFI